MFNITPSSQRRRALLRGATQPEKYEAKYRDYSSHHGASAYSALFVVKAALELAKNGNQDGIRDGLKATDMITFSVPSSSRTRKGTRSSYWRRSTLRQSCGGRTQPKAASDNCSIPSAHLRGNASLALCKLERKAETPTKWATPTLPPPPRRPQNKSAFCYSPAVRSSPSAMTTSARKQIVGLGR
jgi:hypothetical protein